MAVLRFPTNEKTIRKTQEIRAALAPLGIDYERWSLDRVPADAPPIWFWTRIVLRSTR